MLNEKCVGGRTNTNAMDKRDKESCKHTDISGLTDRHNTVNHDTNNGVILSRQLALCLNVAITQNYKGPIAIPVII